MSGAQGPQSRPPLAERYRRSGRERASAMAIEVTAMEFDRGVQLTFADRQRKGCARRQNLRTAHREGILPRAEKGCARSAIRTYGR